MVFFNCATFEGRSVGLAVEGLFDVESGLNGAATADGVGCDRGTGAEALSGGLFELEGGVIVSD
jgi:hypothetical protein